MIFDRFDTAVVPFPFVDMPVLRRRPALVLSTREFNEESGQTIMAMITTAKESTWPSDVPITDTQVAGLVAQCIVRWKLMTVPNSMIVRRLGRLSGEDEGRCRNNLASIFP